MWLEYISMVTWQKRPIYCVEHRSWSRSFDSSYHILCWTSLMIETFRIILSYIVLNIAHDRDVSNHLTIYYRLSNVWDHTEQKLFSRIEYNIVLFLHLVFHFNWWVSGLECISKVHWYVTSRLIMWLWVVNCINIWRKHDLIKISCFTPNTQNNPGIVL